VVGSSVSLRSTSETFKNHGGGVLRMVGKGGRTHGSRMSKVTSFLDDIIGTDFLD